MLQVGVRNEDLFSAVWEERHIPHKWVNAILIPIPKKGKLHCCVNWRGIALLDVVGKVAARIVQTRLQTLAEQVLPETQCGFRRGRGCTDMLFVVRQLAEKAFEHHMKQHFIFVDLRKAYDSILLVELWTTLKKLGVPDLLVDIIWSFHSNMETRIRVDGELLEEIQVNNGLRQGCTMAPTLFNLYASVVAERWTEAVQGIEEAGIELHYKLDQQLFRRSTRGASKVRALEGEFADDVVLVASSREAGEPAGRACVDVTKVLRMPVNRSKTKVIVVGHGVTEQDKLPLPLEGDGAVEWVSEFPYLGSVVAQDGRSHIEVDKKIANASKAFGALR